MIAVLIIPSSDNELDREAWYPWSSTSWQRKSSNELSLVIFLAKQVGHIFQSMTLEAFHSDEYRWRIQCEEVLHLAEEQRSLQIVGQLTACKCPPVGNNLNLWLWELTSSWSTFSLLPVALGTIFVSNNKIQLYSKDHCWIGWLQPLVKVLTSILHWDFSFLGIPKIIGNWGKIEWRNHLVFYFFIFKTFHIKLGCSDISYLAVWAIGIVKPIG